MRACLSHFFRAFVLLTVVLTCAFAHADNVHGVLRVVKGDVQVKSAQTGETAKARIGGQVFPKDVIMTGADSRAKIVMVDNNEINVSPDSKIEIQHYEFDPNAGKKDVLLNVIYGKVRSKVEQKYDGKTTKFQIKTPAAVAGVRGTDFITSFDRRSGNSQVVTFQGKVEFGLPGPGGTIKNAVFVTPGNMSTSAGGQMPSPPASMPKNDLDKMDHESKADTGQNGKSDSSVSGGDQKQSQSGNKGSKDGNGNGAGGNASNGSGSRAPASAGAGNTNMLRPEDNPGDPNTTPAPEMPFGPTSLPITPIMPTTTTIPVCEFCNTLIQTGGNAKLTILIKTQ